MRSVQNLRQGLRIAARPIEGLGTVEAALLARPIRLELAALGPAEIARLSRRVLAESDALRRAGHKDGDFLLECEGRYLDFTPRFVVTPGSTTMITPNELLNRLQERDLRLDLR